MRFDFVSWREVDACCGLLARRIKHAGFKPDIIVGIARGGWVPARLLSDLLLNRNVASIKIEFYEKAGVPGTKPRITQPVSTSVRGKRVLLVDDVADTGESLAAAVAHLKRRGAKEIKVATLHYKPQSIFKPDFFIGETSDWLVYPWEREETRREKKQR